MSLQVGVRPRWPVIVEGTGGVTVERVGARAVIGFDPNGTTLGAELQQAVDAASESATDAETAQGAAEIAQAAAEAAQLAAEEAAGSLIPATQAEAEAGAVNDKGMTPLRVAQAMLGVRTASSVTAAEAITDLGGAAALFAMGVSESGDIVPAPFVSRLSEPSHAGKTLINGVWYELERHDGVYLEDFGGINAVTEAGDVPTGTDNSDAFADAIEYCVKKRRAVIRISSGVWPCTSGGFILPVGINLVGHGHSSSSNQGGSVLLADYDEATAANPFLHWNGSGSAYNATGGGIQHLTVQKGANKTGGTMVLITGVDNANRPGYMTFDGVRLSGSNGSADCDYCMIIDGSNLTTVNGNGVRDVVMQNFFYDGWAVEGMQLNNATHAKLIGVTASPGLGSTTALRISGSSSAPESKTTDLMAVGLSIYGPVVLDNMHQCVVVGRATDLTVTGNCTGSIIQMTTDNTINYSGTSRDYLRRTNKTVFFDSQDDALYVNNAQVIGGRKSGWTPASGTATRSTFATSTVTLPQLAERVKALIDDLHATAGHGLIGS